MKRRPRAVVTGASSGIGRAAALCLAGEGFDVWLLGRDEGALAETARACRERGAAAQAEPCDLARESGRERAASFCRDIDCLVNNAGFTVHGAFARTPLERELELLQVQLASALRLTKEALPAMIARGRGRILNVGSVYSFAPVPEQAVYAAGKAFLASFSAALREELRGTGVTVTLFCPGVVRTELRRRAGVASAEPDGGLSAEKAAALAVRAALSGRASVIPGSLNRLFAGAGRLLGPDLMAGVAGAVNRRRGLRPAR